MSRIGKLPVRVPPGVTVQISGAVVRIEGPKGKLEHRLPKGIAAEVADGAIRVTRADDTRPVRSVHGLTQKLVSNMVRGVSQGFTRTLEIVGVGYRAEGRGQALHLALGYSHPI